MGRKAKIAVVLIALVPFVLLCTPFWDWIPDDAYISFQYARSLVEGDGLVFNPGERVEGLSNLLWTLTLALVARMGWEIESAAPVLSLAAALASLGLILVLLLQTHRHLGATDHRGVSFVTGIMLFASASFFPFVFYASSGLETTPYLLCLLTGAVLHLVAVDKGLTFPHYLSLLAFLAGAIMRPEGIGFLGLNAVFLLMRQRHGLSRALVTAVLLTFLAYLVVLSVKYQYFGSVVPNTYYAKPGAAWHYLSPLSRGAQYVVRFFGKSGLILLLPFALLLPSKARARYAWFYLWAFAAYQVFFIVFVGADVLRFDRFTVPLVPWLIALASMGVIQLLQGPHTHFHVWARRLAGVSVAVIVALSAAQALKAHRKYCIHDWMHGHLHREIGRFIGTLLPQDGEIVSNEIGAIRYYSRRPVVDMLGLTDDTVSAIRYRSFQTYGIGSSAWSASSVTRYVLDRNPACVVLPSYEELSLRNRFAHKETMHPLWYTILTDPRFESGYRPLCYIKIHRDKYLYIFVRDDIPARLPIPDYSPGTCFEMHRLGG